MNSLAARAKSDPWATGSLALGLCAAYLCLVNLDTTALWHDEGPSAVIGLNLLEQGDITGWDGRNLVGGTDARTINEDLRDVLPPVQYVLNAIGFAVFGPNVTAARIIHALAGIAALGIFWLLLRQRLPEHPRLQFLIFASAAGSAQLLLYFRQSRYFAAMVLLLLLLFWLHGHYQRTRKPALLIALGAVAVLCVLNHYTSGSAALVTLTVWHLLFHARQTTRKEWAMFALCAAGVAAVVSGYLLWIGLIGGERGSFIDFAGQAEILHYQNLLSLTQQQFGAILTLYKVFIYIRDLFTADWISWPVFVWFLAMLALAAIAKVRKSPAEKVAGANSIPLADTGKIILAGGLFALFAATLSPQIIQLNIYADQRYYVAALPLLLAMKGLFAEWVWKRNALLGFVALLVLATSSLGAWPFNLKHAITYENTLGWHWVSFVREIHNPYRESIAAVSDYLLRHAAQDDLVLVQDGFAYREALTFHAGDRVLFCCFLTDKTPLPREKTQMMRKSLFQHENTPNWIVIFDPQFERELSIGDRIKVNKGPQLYSGFFEVAEKFFVFPYPTQRPELNMHSFKPLGAEPQGILILKKHST